MTVAPLKKGIVVLAILLTFPIIPVSAEPILATKGFLDLTALDLETANAVPLNGEWSFFWGKLVEPGSFASGGSGDGSPAYAVIPGPWDGIETVNGTAEAYGFGTYRLLVKTRAGSNRLAIKTLTASTAMDVWVNGNLLIETGKVGTSPGSTREMYLPSVATFDADENGMVDIVIHVANWKYRKGGLWERILLGSERKIDFERLKANAVSITLFGSLFIMSLYHFGLYFFRRKDPSPLIFGLGCMIIAVRTLVVGDMPLMQLLDGNGIPWTIQVKMELLSLYLAVPIFPLLLRSLYPRDVPKWYVYPILAVSVVFGLATVIAPVGIASKFVLPFQAFMMLMFALGFAFLAIVIARKRTESILILAGYSCVVAAAVNDILYTNYIVDTGVFLPLGLLALVFFQAISLSSRFSRSFSMSESLTEKMASLNSSLSRFVPIEFIKFLDKKDITEVELGDQVKRKLTILFSDIREFTTITESLDPEESFDFLNAYLRRMGPIIRAHGGIIDKYIGDAIMALFPGDEEEAVRAGIDIQKELAVFNRELGEVGAKAIQVGIGIHSGEMILGTIGELNRMETTVISDAVNLASRIEDLTKKYNAKVLVSGTVFDTLGGLSGIDCRFIDRLQVKGKKEVVSIYEVLQGDLANVELKTRTRPVFEKGIDLYREREYGAARKCFEEVARMNTDDRAAFVWIDRCGKAMLGLMK